MSLYLGLDCSTQGLTATVIEVEAGVRRMRLERSIEFDATFPQYGTKQGVLRSATDPRIVCAPPLMWAEALDTVMRQVAEELGDEVRRVRAISGSAQQHGSVYVNERATDTLTSLQPGTPLVQQLQGMFSRDVSPVWMDSSTTEQCSEITRALGGWEHVAALTGSRAFERFTGPQIRRFYQTDPAAYARTSRVHLVSSFMASLLAGAVAPIDYADGAGMNLMDIRRRAWAPAAVDATAPGLRAKLPALAESWTAIGPLAAYWQSRYGWPAARAVAWSGDNPCSLIGTGLVREGLITISLGTSDTVFGFMTVPRIDPAGDGSVFGSPTGHYMGLTCFSNGSLARERVRERYGLTWESFSAALRRTPPGNNGAMMLPWFEPEITPTVARPGVRRRGVREDDADANVRAVVEGQMLAMKRHAAWMGVRVDTIRATGGGSANREMLRVMADVFGAPVYQLEVTNSAALGAALRAYHADALASGHALSWEDVIAGFVEPIASSRIDPTPERERVYEEMEREHAAFEASELEKPRSG